LRAFVRVAAADKTYREGAMAANPDLLRRLQSAVVRVGEGRGFVIETDSERFVLTATHCLPRFPTPNGGWDHTYRNLLGPLDQAEPTVWAECRFVDPIADLAVLATPDDQELFEQAPFGSQARAGLGQTNDRMDRCCDRDRQGDAGKQDQIQGHHRRGSCLSLVPGLIASAPFSYTEWCRRR
jgi:hypothetical protein